MGRAISKSRDHFIKKLAEEQAQLVRGVVCTDSCGGYDAVELNESPLLGLSNMRAGIAGI